MCAIFGVLDYKGMLTATQRLRMVKSLGTAAEIRGTDATGIAYFQRDKLCIQKAPKPAHKMRYHTTVYPSNHMFTHMSRHIANWTCNNSAIII